MRHGQRGVTYGTRGLELLERVAHDWLCDGRASWSGLLKYWMVVLKREGMYEGCRREEEEVLKVGSDRSKREDSRRPLQR